MRLYYLQITRGKAVFDRSPAGGVYRPRGGRPGKQGYCQINPCDDPDDSRDYAQNRPAPGVPGFTIGFPFPVIRCQFGSTSRLWKS